MRVPRQFDFSRNWQTKIAPLLGYRDVVGVLTLGMMLDDPSYREGDPPWEHGRGPWNGQRAKRGCLSWYQPWGRCHSIAPFCWAIGRRLFPELEWGFITGDFHTVVIGWSDNWEKPDWVMDILLFKEKTAEESLAFANLREWSFCRTLAEYAGSFCRDDQEGVTEMFRRTLSQAGIEGATASEPLDKDTRIETSVGAPTDIHLEIAGPGFSSMLPSQ